MHQVKPNDNLPESVLKAQRDTYKWQLVATTEELNELKSEHAMIREEALNQVYNRIFDVYSGTADPHVCSGLMTACEIVNALRKHP